MKRLSLFFHFSLMVEFKQKLEQARNTKSTRVWIMVAITVILFILWWSNIIKTAFAIGLGIVVLAAIGIETINYDLDLDALWSGKSLQESRVTHTKDGLKLMGSCALPTKWEGDLNCANFATQAEAQAKYDQCASEIASDNAWIDISKIKSLDIYGLDANKNGIVCEALPGAPKSPETIEVNTTTQTPPSRYPATKNTPTPTGAYPTTPIPHITEPYPATPASNRSTPKSLPQ